MNMEFNRMSALGGTVSDDRKGPSRRTLRMRLHMALVFVDVLCIVIGFAIAAELYPLATGAANNVLGQAELTAAMMIPLYCIVAFATRSYSVEVINSVTKAVARPFQALVMAAAGVLLIAFYLKNSDDLSRAVFGIGFAGSVIVLGIGRLFFVRKAKLLLGGNPYSVTVITDSENLAPANAFTSILRASDFDPDDHNPEMYDRLARALSGTDRVVLDCAPDRREAWVHVLKGGNVQAEILVPELEATHPLGVARFDGAPTLVMTRGPLSLPDRVTKRAFDVAMAGSALLVFLPLLLVTALAIKLESRGPVLFVQTRIGRSNRLFRMFKFRSMRSEASDGVGNTSTARDDDRITRVGRFIRASSIDELPQLINVLIGDMSIVGPRPHATGSRAENRLFWEIDERYWHRHAAKPGLTGLAQVRGFRGATDHEHDLVNRLQADLEYLDDWSLWRDVKIIVMTFGVLKHKNAF